MRQIRRSWPLGTPKPSVGVLGDVLGLVALIRSGSLAVSVEGNLVTVVGEGLLGLGEHLVDVLLGESCIG